MEVKDAPVLPILINMTIYLKCVHVHMSVLHVQEKYVWVKCILHAGTLYEIYIWKKENLPIFIKYFESIRVPLSKFPVQY